jgi:hypothetical protein
MQHEYDPLMDNGTWELFDLLADIPIVNIMWIYKIESDTKSEVSRCKARFVAMGYSQRSGLDYRETFSAVIRMACLRLLLAIAPATDLEPCPLDIGTAFLYAPVEEDVCIRQPLGFAYGTPKVCYLLKRCFY